MCLSATNGRVKVASNIIPASQQNGRARGRGKYAEALEIHNKYFSCSRTFSRVNRSIKAAMAMYGMIEEEYDFLLSKRGEKNGGN
jgi:dihydrodipicolinate synthase/N-acetylneuraminate lyase